MLRWLRSSIAVVVVFAGSLIAANAVQAQVINLNTGVDAGGNVIARGALDPFWKIAIGAGSQTSAMRGSLANECCGMETVGPNSGWITDPSQDVGANSEFTSWGSDWTTAVRLSRTFDLTSYDLSTVALAGIWRVADNQTGFFLNGNLIVAGGPQSGFIEANYGSNNAFSVGTGSAFFNQGLNTLEVVAYSGNSMWDGLYIDAAVRGAITTVPEPSTMVLVGSALFGLAVVRRRRRA